LTLGQTLLQLIVVFILVFLNAFFVAAEFAMVRIRSSRLSQLVEEGNPKATVAQQVISHLDAYLSATQLGITLASLGLGWLGEPTIAKLIDQPLSWMGVPSIAVPTIAFTLAFLVITFLHIIIGELAPKSLAIHRSEETVLRISRPLILFYKLMYPFIQILNASANRLLKWIGIEPATEGQLAHTEEEIRILVNESHQSGFIDQTEMALLDSIFEFSDRIAREIMIPRVEMVTIDVNEPQDEILKIVQEEQLTRYPVSDGDKDHIIGFVHIKDIYLKRTRNERYTIGDLVRKVIFVPEAMEISTVLKQMQKQRTQIAIVVDEYGGTAGLVTLEDIIEELVGEIHDEFDLEELPPIQKVNDAYSVEGLVLVEEINDLLGTNIDDENIETIGGWMYSLLQKQPEVGDSVEIGGYTFTIEVLDDNRIERIKIQKQPVNESSEVNVQ
jgi:CBS domain containing-hemolysin-like protein